MTNTGPPPCPPGTFLLARLPRLSAPLPGGHCPCIGSESPYASLLLALLSSCTLGGKYLCVCVSPPFLPVSCPSFSVSLPLLIPLSLPTPNTWPRPSSLCQSVFSHVSPPLTVSFSVSLLLLFFSVSLLCTFHAHDAVSVPSDCLSMGVHLAPPPGLTPWCSRSVTHSP